MARFVIVGCGDLGQELGRQLVVAGHDVFGTRRRARGLPAGIREIEFDVLLDDPESLPEADGLIYSVSAGSRDPARYRAVYSEGPRRLIDQLGERVERWVFVSSTSVYLENDGGLVDEASPTASPDDVRGSALLGGESAFAALGGQAMRLAGIYGPGRTSLLRRTQEGRWGPSVATWRNRIHRDDAARAIVRVLEIGNPAAVYNVVDNEPALLAETYAWLADRLGVEGPDGLAGAHPSGKRVSNKRLLATGWSPRWPTWRDGYEQLIRDWSPD